MQAGIRGAMGMRVCVRARVLARKRESLFLEARGQSKARAGKDEPETHCQWKLAATAESQARSDKGNERTQMQSEEHEHSHSKVQYAIVNGTRSGLGRLWRRCCRC